MQKVSCRQVRAGLETHRYCNSTEIKVFTKTKYTGTISSLACELSIGAAKNYKVSQRLQEVQASRDWHPTGIYKAASW